MSKDCKRRKLLYLFDLMEEKEKKEFCRVVEDLIGARRNEPGGRLDKERKLTPGQP